MLTQRLDPRMAGLPPGRRVYAVGDVHGHRDRLVRIHDAVRADLTARPTDGATLVHLGDLIDRGPDSAGVVELVLAGPPAPGLPVVNLMGNHEWMLLTALTSGRAEDADVWLENGGLDTLRSWGITVRSPVRDWPGLVPRAHLLFLRDLLPQWGMAGALFVHAGIRPGVPLAEQSREDLLWIREAFLRHPGPMLPDAPDTLVVHGHTPSKAPDLQSNRLGLDTGAGRGGPLTCAVLEASEVHFIQA